MNYRVITYWVGVLLLAPLLAQAGGGLKLNLSGYRYLGMGYTGVGLSLDASSIYLNPGAVGFLRKNAIQLGSSFVRPSTTYSAQNQFGSSFSSESTDMEENTITPISLFLNWRKRDSRLMLGLGVYNPFGYVTQWPEGWKGKLISQESTLNSLYIQPTASYRINDQIGVGAGLVYGLANFLVQRTLDINGRNNTEGWLELAGQGTGLGYNLGIFYKPGIRFTIGLNYRSHLKVDVDDGEVSFNVPPSLQSEFERDTVFSTQMTLPGILSLGISYKSLDNLLFAVDINYTFWKVYDKWELQYQSPVEDLNPRLDKELIRNFSNSLSIRMGAEYSIQQKYYFRFGTIFNQSPVQDGFVSPEFPDSDRIGVTAGLGINLFENFLIDLAYKYEFTGESFGELAEEVFAGKYESNANVLGIGLTYSF